MEEIEVRERLKKDKNKPLYCGDITIVNIDDLETVLNLLEKKDRTIQQLKDENKTLNKQAQQYFETTIIQSQQYNEETTKKDKIINEIQEEVRNHISFENRLKRDNREPDLFNQGRFYVANNINNILKGK